jgi:hypothetical protein
VDKSGEKITVRYAFADDDEARPDGTAESATA